MIPTDSLDPPFAFLQDQPNEAPSRGTSRTTLREIFYCRISNQCWGCGEGCQVQPLQDSPWPTLDKWVCRPRAHATLTGAERSNLMEDSPTCSLVLLFLGDVTSPCASLCHNIGRVTAAWRPGRTAVAVRMRVVPDTAEHVLMICQAGSPPPAADPQVDCHLCKAAKERWCHGVALEAHVVYSAVLASCLLFLNHSFLMQKLRTETPALRDSSALESDAYSGTGCAHILWSERASHRVCPDSGQFPLLPFFHPQDCIARGPGVGEGVPKHHCLPAA